MSSDGRASASGIGNGHEDAALVAELPRRGSRPPPPRRRCPPGGRAACPLDRIQNAGSSSVPKPSTGTPASRGARACGRGPETPWRPRTPSREVRRERAEVGADVARGLDPSVHPADPARREHARHRRGQRAPAPPTPSSRRTTSSCATANGQVACRDLARAGEHALVLGWLEPDTGNAVDHGGDPRDGARSRTAAVQRSRASAFAGLGKPEVREDRRLERHHGPPLGERGRDLGRESTSRSSPRLRRRARHRERAGRHTRAPLPIASSTGAAAAERGEEAGRERVAGSGRVCCRRDRDRRDFGDRATTVDRDGTVATTVDDSERHALRGAI